jgi:hypothetical protein
MEQVMMVDEQCDTGVVAVAEQALHAKAEQAYGFHTRGPNMNYFLLNAIERNNNATRAFVPDGADVTGIDYYPSRREYRLHWRKSVLQGSHPRVVGLGLREPAGDML